MDLILFGTIFFKIIFKWLVNQTYGLGDIVSRNFAQRKDFYVCLYIRRVDEGRVGFNWLTK